MPKRNPLVWNEENLRRWYVDEQKSIPEIAAECGSNDASVVHAMRFFGIPSRTAAESRMLRGTARRRIFVQLENAEWLHECYVDKMMTTDEIAAEIGCTGVPVQRALIHFGIPRRKAGAPRPGHNHPVRFTELQDAVWLRHQYIELKKSPEIIASELGCTAMTVATRLADAGVRKRERLPRGEALKTAAPRKRNKGGYVAVWSPDHPAADNQGWVKEHRLVAERVLGRFLTRGEVVHHLNVQRDDNREENLLVFPNNAKHMSFHENPPAWVPRCPCCGKPNPEVLAGRPEGVPMYWSESSP